MQETLVQEDFRQSEKWAKYLNTNGWKSYTTQNGITLNIYKKFGFSVAKVQRPQTLRQSDILEFEKICKDNKCLVITIEPQDQQSASLLQNSGYQKSKNPLSPTKTLIIELEQDEKLQWNALSTSGKYGVNRAKREGVAVYAHQNPSAKIVEKFYNLYKNSAQQKNFTPYSYEDLLSKARIFGDDCYILLAQNKNLENLSGGFYVCHKKSVWYLHGGTTRFSNAAGGSKSGYLLFWEAILYFKQQGFLLLDLEGIYDKRVPFTKKWQGFTEFKSKFGGNTLEFPESCIKVFNPVLSVMNKFFPLGF